MKRKAAILLLILLVLSLNAPIMAVSDEFDESADVHARYLDEIVEYDARGEADGETAELTTSDGKTILIEDIGIDVQSEDELIVTIDIITEDDPEAYPWMDTKIKTADISDKEIIVGVDVHFFLNGEEVFPDRSYKVTINLGSDAEGITEVLYMGRITPIAARELMPSAGNIGSSVYAATVLDGYELISIPYRVSGGSVTFTVPSGYYGGYIVLLGEVRENVGAKQPDENGTAEIETKDGDKIIIETDSTEPELVEVVVVEKETQPTDYEKISDALKKAEIVGDFVALEVEFRDGDGKVLDPKTGYQVTMPSSALPKEPTAYFLTEDGRLIKLEVKIENGKVTAIVPEGLGEGRVIFVGKTGTLPDSPPTGDDCAVFVLTSCLLCLSAALLRRRQTR